MTSNGNYAVARCEGSPELLLVDLKTHKVTPLVLSSPVTDLDLLPSGTQAVRGASRREQAGQHRHSRRLHRRRSAKTYQFSDVTIGSVTMSPQGKYAVLYTTAIPSDEPGHCRLHRRRLSEPWT